MQQSSAGALSTRALLNDKDAIRALGPISFVGQSHVACLIDALADAPDNVRLTNLWTISNPLLGNERPALKAMQESFKGVVVSVLGGSRFEALTMYRHPRPFDFVSPLEPDAPLDPDAEIMPYAAFRALVADLVSHNVALIKALRRMSEGALLLQVLSPPPWGDARKVSDWDPGFIQPTDQFGPRHLRRKNYRVQIDIMREACAELGIEVIAPPAETLDQEGFLKREFSKDLAHGNLAYGQALAEKILQRIAELKAHASS